MKRTLTNKETIVTETAEENGVSYNFTTKRNIAGSAIEIKSNGSLENKETSTLAYFTASHSTGIRSILFTGAPYDKDIADKVFAEFDLIMADNEVN